MFCLFWAHTEAIQTPSKIRSIYYSLDPQSISQHLAFYFLYPQTDEGKLAFRDVCALFASHQAGHLSEHLVQALLKPSMIEPLIKLVNRQPDHERQLLDEEQLWAIDQLCQHFPNRRLKGHHVTSEAEVLRLPSNEIDLARGLFLSQFAEDPQCLQKARNYEATVDLMALQIAAKLPNEASDREKIRAINDYVFKEQGFRFPPHSVYAKNIDVYTFLPSVIDSRRGVCLGVSILYLCIAQRLNLPLEMITPPGHIYIRYHNANALINIETTARGIHIDSEEYLSVDTRSLQERNIKEVIGLAHFNQASVFWKDRDYASAMKAYEKARHYLPQDLLLQELMGYTAIFLNDEVRARQLLEPIKHHTPDYAVSKETIAEDYLDRKVDAKGVQAIFSFVDENRESLLQKKRELEETITQFPQFRAAYFHLASVWLQLNREGEALEILKKYHALNPNDVTAEYYLTVLYAQRFNYNQAWEHFHHAEQLAQARDHHPKILKELRQQLRILCPE